MWLDFAETPPTQLQNGLFIILITALDANFESSKEETAMYMKF